MHENYGKRGVLVLIVPSEKIDLEYFKVVSKNVNDTFRFTFGSSINKMIYRKISDYDLTEGSQLQQNYEKREEIVMIKSQLDKFFTQINKRLCESTQFELFNNRLDDAKQNMISNSSSLKSTPDSRLLAYANRLNIYNEMRTKFLNSYPYYDLPFNIKTDLDSALVNLEAQEFVDLENTSYKNRRLFSVQGSCLFFKVTFNFFSILTLVF